MCKAKDYSEKLLEIYNSINVDTKYYNEELSQADLYEQDILHVIEMGGFNAVEGYYLSKKICDNRQARRQIKNELEPLQQLKRDFIDQNINLLNTTHQSVSKRGDTLNYRTENKIYVPRVLGTTDIKMVVDNTKVKNIDTITKYKKTKEPINIMCKVDKDLYYVHFSKTDHKGLVNAKDIENLDNTQLA